MTPAPRPADGPFRAALRAVDPLAWAALGAALVLATFPVYWVAMSVVPLFGGSEGHAADFLIYSRAGHRVLADPATLYADPSFLYPPPSGVLMALAVQVPMAWGYALFAALNAVALAGCLVLVERLLPAPPTGWARGALWAVAFASAPALQNLKYGQVNVLVLLAALGFLALLRERPAWAGAVLALGVWLKVYPVVLGLFALTRRAWPAVLGLAGAMLGIAVALWPLFPPALYAEYLTGVFAELPNATTTSTLNAGLPAAVERLGLGPEALLDYISGPFGPAAQLTARLALVGGVAAVWTAWARGWDRTPAAFALLAVIPVASGLGWEYTFVLALPAVLAMLLAARRAGLAGRFAALAAALVLMLQKPPEAVMKWAVREVPDPLLDAFAARFLFALGALALVAWSVRRRSSEGAVRTAQTVLRTGARNAH